MLKVLQNFMQMLIFKVEGNTAPVEIKDQPITASLQPREYDGIGTS
jgi:hypothetical protein